MTRRIDPCNALIAAVMAMVFAALALAIVLFPPSRPCKPHSYERLFTNCEVRP